MTLRNKRDARLAAKPRCQLCWANLADQHWNKCSWHQCKKFLDHAGRQHECSCGAQKVHKPREASR